MTHYIINSHDVISTKSNKKNNRGKSPNCRNVQVLEFSATIHYIGKLGCVFPSIESIFDGNSAVGEVVSVFPNYFVVEYRDKRSGRILGYRKTAIVKGTVMHSVQLGPYLGERANVGK